MKRLHKIALHGMKGRKKDTAVLALVIAMSFLFLTVGTMLLSSLTESQRQQRMELYGSWKLADSRKDPATEKRLSGQDWISGSHEVKILGTDSSCGAVAVWDGDFARMGGLQLSEGRAPEAPGEIVLEKGQLSLLPEGTGIGSEVTLELSYEGQPRPEKMNPGLPETLEVFGITVKAAPFQKALAQDITGKRLENSISAYIENFDSIVKMYRSWGMELPEMPMELPKTAEELSPEQMEQFLQILADEPVFLYTMVGANPPCISIRNLKLLQHPKGTTGSVRWELDTAYSMNTCNASVPDDLMVQYGGVAEQSLTLSRTCCITGILETTADRWDVTDISVPNCYISAPTMTELQDTAETLCSGQRPEKFYADAGTVLTQSSFTLYETELPMKDAYAKLQSIPGNLLRKEDTTAFYELNPPIPDLSMEEAELKQEAAEVLEVSAEEIARAVPAESSLYSVTFESDDETSGETEAWFLVPGIFTEMQDGSRNTLEASWGFLIWQESGQWNTEKADASALLYTDFAPTGCRSLGWLPETLEEAYAYNRQTVGLNRYAYPSEQGLTAAMGGTLVTVIVVITVCAVFQIFFTQLRRRTRKLTLLRSIGATSGQLFALLGMEGAYITAGGLILGDGLGLLTAYLIAENLPDTVFYVQHKLFFTGQFWGILAVFAGGMLPSLRAVRAPLTGRMTGKRHHHGKVRPMKRQTFRRVCFRDLKANPGRTLGMAALCIFLMTMQLVCVFRGNSAFDTYRETIADADQPDFTLTMNHAGSKRKTEPMTEALRKTEGLERCDFYRRGENLYLWYEGMEESPVIRAVRETDSRFFTSSKSEEAEKTEPGLITEFYGIEPGTDLMDRLLQAVTDGSMDRTAYEAGEEVLVLLPMYAEKDGGREPEGNHFTDALRSADRMDFSFSPSSASAWEKDGTIAPGKQLTLGTDAYVMGEKNSGYTQNLHEVRVGAVIRYFPEKGIWPFAGEPRSHVIVGSRKAMSRLYSDGFTTYDPEQMQFIDTRVRYFMPTEYGTGVWNLYAKEDAAVETTLSPLSRFAKQEHLTLHNHMDSKRSVYEKAVASAILAGTLALAATVIVWMILFNTLNSAQEQGRHRTGILQSLGVSKKQFYGAEAAQAVFFWLLTVLISNLILLGIVLISGAASQAGQGMDLMAVLKISLRGYPWWLHGVLCVLELPVLLVFSLHAAGIPMKYSPIDNIRS